jgi:signal transduction histidine kinase
MTSVEQSFHDDIEVERLWAATKQGELIFFSILPLSIIFVFLLWEQASHTFLLTWFAIINVINLLRWISIQFFHTHKEMLAANIRRFKCILMAGSTASGLWWGIAILWFLEPSQPVNVLILCLYVFIVSVGALVAWFCYLPAVLAVLVPTAGSMSVLLFIEGERINVAISLIFVILIIMAVSGSLKLARMLNHALLLSFENLALRQESEEKSLLLETALENMGQGISMADRDDRLRMWNKQFTDMLGVAGNKVATDINLESILNAADPPLIVHAEKRIQHQLKDERVFEVRQTELRNGGRVLTYTDISDLIKREQALEQARKSAELANAAKTRFLAAASHDLRQPIHALGLFFAELSDRVQSVENETLIAQVEDSITAINSMLNALLDVSKLDAGVVKPNIACFKLTEIFTRLEAEFMPISIENNNQLRIRHATISVNSDPAMLERMLRNLIGNALRYTKNGRVLVAARPCGDKVEILVFDTGPGIPEDQLDEIFYEFHQLGNPARDRRQGLGLGLAIVKRQASLLKHEIKVTSHLGRGCCFSITVPRVRNRQTESGEKSVNLNRIHSLEGFQILVLDDDIAVLEGMRGLLTRWGCQVITAASPNEAFAQLDVNQKQPELLIVDYRLPDNVSGIEVAKQLQESLAYPVAVLIITGDTGPERLREADNSGYPLLHKPVHPAKLRSTLQYLLSKQNTA